MVLLHDLCCCCLSRMDLFHVLNNICCFFLSLTNKYKNKILSNKTGNTSMCVFRLRSVVVISQSHSPKEVCDCRLYFMCGFCRQIFRVQQCGQEQFSPTMVYCAVHKYVRCYQTLCDELCHVGCYTLKCAQLSVNPCRIHTCEFHMT